MHASVELEVDVGEVRDGVREVDAAEAGGADLEVGLQEALVFADVGDGQGLGGGGDRSDVNRALIAARSEVSRGQSPGEERSDES